MIAPSGKVTIWRATYRKVPLKKVILPYQKNTEIFCIWVCVNLTAQFPPDYFMKLIIKNRYELYYNEQINPQNISRAQSTMEVNMSQKGFFQTNFYQCCSLPFGTGSCSLQSGFKWLVHKSFELCGIRAGMRGIISRGTCKLTLLQAPKLLSTMKVKWKVVVFHSIVSRNSYRVSLAYRNWKYWGMCCDK